MTAEPGSLGLLGLGWGGGQGTQLRLAGLNAVFSGNGELAEKGLRHAGFSSLTQPPASAALV